MTDDAAPRPSPNLRATHNWDTARYADTVEVITTGGAATQLLVDGERFPYLLAEGYQIYAGENDVTRITVTFFATHIMETERSRDTGATADPVRPTRP